MKKKLNTEAIANELSGGSAFFPHDREQPAPSPPLAADDAPGQTVAAGQQPPATSLAPSPPLAEPQGPLTTRAGEDNSYPSPRPPVPSVGTYGADVGNLRTGPTGIPPGRRRINRHPFDVYTDQVARLKRLALHETLAGGQGSMSRMVREAIDAYLALHEPEPQDA